MRNKVIATFLALTLGYTAMFLLYTWPWLYINTRKQTVHLHPSSIKLQSHVTAVDSNEATDWNTGDSRKQSLIPMPPRNSSEHTQTQAQSVYQPIPYSNGDKHGYVLALDYGGQQGAGVRGLVSQQCWVGSFSLPMDIVEPFVQDSLVGNAKEPESTIRFSDYFDIDHFNSVSEREGYAKLATWEEFLEKAPRDIVYVNMHHNLNQPTRQTNKNLAIRNKGRNGAEMAWSHWRSTKLHDFDISGGITWDTSIHQQGSTHKCYKMTGQMPPQLTTLGRHGFCVVRIVKLPYTDTHILEKWERDAIFTGLKPQNISVVFNLWVGHWYAPNYALENPLICQNVSATGLEGKFYPSQLLLKHAKSYEDMFLQPKSSIAVMLRVEQVLVQLHSMNTRGSRSERTLDSCLAEAK